jgi:protocatechuate 3,4-dioxygenase beta subunit
VLDPEGKPLAGAKLYLGFYRTAEGDLPVRAVSGTGGRFDFTFAASELDKTYSDHPTFQVAAAAKGYGFDFATVREQDTDGEITLRLVKDVPISGLILDQEGRPVVGANVRATEVMAYKNEDLKEYLEAFRKGADGTYPTKDWSGPLPGQTRALVTGADGRIHLSGVGRERMVRLRVEGSGIQYARLEVMTRPGELMDSPSPYRQQRVYGAAFTYLAPPARPLRGTVRDKDTGKPVAGARIESVFTTHVTYTDKEGRYKLAGYAKAPEYDVTAVPAVGQPYFTANVKFRDTPGFAPLEADIEMVRGIALRGRITDKETGQPVRGTRIEYHPLYPNPNTGNGPRDATATAGADGTYALVVLPGPGVLAVTAERVPQEQYMTALVTPKELAAFYKNWRDPGGNSSDFLLISAGGNAARGLVQENHHALVLLEPQEKTDKITVDVTLQPALTRKGSVTGPDGQPLGGALVFGLTAHPFAQETLKTADFTVRGINPKRTRALLFIHKEKGLGYYGEIHGDEKEPLTVRLEPLGSASGRVVDKDGQPVPGLLIHVNRSGFMGPGGTQVQTDEGGRFRAEGLVPSQKYELVPAKRSIRLSGPPKGIIVESGRNKELGDVVAGPGNN